MASLAKQQVGKSASWQNGKLLIQPFGETASWQNGKFGIMAKWQVGETPSW